MGHTPQEFATIVSNEYRMLWDRIGIQYDHFIRTTEPRHHETVRWFFERCLANGYVYKGSYTGQYCVSDEFYVNEAQPGDPCPLCGRPLESVTEEVARVLGSSEATVRSQISKARVKVKGFVERYFRRRI